MKNLKVTINRSAGVKKYEVLPRQEKDMQCFKRKKRMQCPCCGGAMDRVQGVWLCQRCSYCITQKDMLDLDTTFWFCDECGRFMNVQPGFTDKTGAWKCIACGFVNDVSEENVGE